MSGTKANNGPSDKQLTQMGGPWLPLQNPLKKLIPQVKQANSKPWEYGPDVVEGLNSQQQQAIQRGTEMGLGPGSNQMQGAADFAGNVASGQMVGKGAGQDYVNKIANEGVQGPAYGQLQQILGEAMGGSGGLEYARDIAGGKMLGANPYIDKLVGDVNKDATNALLPQLEGRMAMSGRSGSGAEGVGQGEIARQLASKSNEIRYGDYNAERGYQQQAGLALPGMQATELATKGAAAGDVNADAYARIQQQLGAAGMAGDAQSRDVNTALNAGGFLKNAIDNQYEGIDRALGYQGMAQSNQERENAEAQERFQYQQSEPYERINRMLGQYQGIGGMTDPSGANATYAQSLNRPSGFQQGVGNLLGIAGGAAQIAAPFLPGQTAQRVATSGAAAQRMLPYGSY
jgi:hypothetical protein